MQITFISDTHSNHRLITDDLPGGDIIIHSGDISSMGHQQEIKEFCGWFSKLPYTHKIFIAGNHDWGFQRRQEESLEIVRSFKEITYLQDRSIELNGIKIYGTPWQPEFCNWAFNLPREGSELKAVWDKVPEDTDILITHGPQFGYSDTIENQYEHLGCPLLTDRVAHVKPKIHVFGHIHTGEVHTITHNHVHCINASVLNEAYNYTREPVTINWDPNTNEIE